MSLKSLGLYIHIPFCQRKCHYCDFSSYPEMESYWDAYVDAVVTELIMKAEEYKNPAINTLFIGGGTPSLIPPRFILKILSAVQKYYKVSKELESTIETNPGTLTEEKLRAYKDFGINRLSIGLQACQDELLNSLGRIHNYNDFIFSLSLAKKHGFDNINADIIFGIPHQTISQWQDTVESILTHEITHISCYSLIIEDETVFGRQKKDGLLTEIDEDLDREMYHYAVESFNKAGFHQYEISNFAKPHYECRHNMNYWKRGDYLGFGSGAHSFYQNRRFANTSDVLEYIKGVNNRELVLSENNYLTQEDAIEEFIFLGLRLNEGIDLSKLSKEFGTDIEKRYDSKVDKLIKQRLVERKSTMLRLTKRGMDLANAVILELINTCNN